MGYSIETRTESLDMRQGFYNTLEEAKGSIFRRDAKPKGAAIYAGNTTSGGTIVAVFDPEYGWIDVEGVAAPRWWDDVSDEAREWLVAHPNEAVPSWVWVPLVKAGGSVYSVQWDGGDPSGMSLVLADEEWLRFQRALDAAR